VKVLVLDRIPAIGWRPVHAGSDVLQGLREIGVDVHPVHLESPLERNGTTAGFSEWFWA